MSGDASGEASAEVDRGGFWIDALVGAAVTVVLSFIPFSPVVGGAVAGYLRTDELEDGATVGAASGLIAALPVVGLLLLIFGGLSAGMLGLREFGGALLFGGLFWIAALFAGAFVVGLSAVGGLLGAYLAGRQDRLR